MYVVVNSTAKNVYGPFASEEIAIAWGKAKYLGFHFSWWTEKLIQPL